MSLSDAQALVRAFHEKFEAPVATSPVVLDDERQESHQRRIDWIGDELDEADEALDSNGAIGVADLADAYLDIIYFALGGLVELGVDGGPLFEAIHAANMAKVKLPGVAKIAKPPGWVAPDIAGLIEAQRAAKR